MDIESAVRVFAECAVGMHDSIWTEANSSKTNLFADRQIEAMKHLQSQGDLGRNALMPLLFDPRPAVRVNAAVFLLRHCNAEAMAVLLGFRPAIRKVWAGASEILAEIRER